jgi:hypothetical protein
LRDSIRHFRSRTINTRETSITALQSHAGTDASSSRRETCLRYSQPNRLAQVHAQPRIPTLRPSCSSILLAEYNSLWRRYLRGAILPASSGRMIEALPAQAIGRCNVTAILADCTLVAWQVACASKCIRLRLRGALDDNALSSFAGGGNHRMVQASPHLPMRRR